jgi:glycosyltransferase involved in cell wall biosynthesis
VLTTVSRILNDRSIAQRMGREARNTALREFSLAQFVGQTEQVYLEGRAVTRPAPQSA